ncbi:hypothetical protein A4X13_0g4338 [Tilletia indica]|uniref:Uncharacterized protein n=1 Tax=Tilletia indica TaxID=43049 RepID=A0A177TC71_9BASI|nr:hypothetical protein A4X13_0g4338 [Tilletia indica]
MPSPNAALVVPADDTQPRHSNALIPGIESLQRPAQKSGSPSPIVLTSSDPSYRPAIATLASNTARGEHDKTIGHSDTTHANDVFPSPSLQHLPDSSRTLQAHATPLNDLSSGDAPLMTRHQGTGTIAQDSSPPFLDPLVPEGDAFNISESDAAFLFQMFPADDMNSSGYGTQPANVVMTRPPQRSDWTMDLGWSSDPPSHSAVQPPVTPQNRTQGTSGASCQQPLNGRPSPLGPSRTRQRNHPPSPSPMRGSTSNLPALTLVRPFTPRTKSNKSAAAPAARSTKHITPTATGDLSGMFP